jgi:hypothetical protein
VTGRSSRSGHGDIIVRAKHDGTYDKTNLPDELVMTSYFAIREGKITSRGKLSRTLSTSSIGAPSPSVYTPTRLSAPRYVR